MTINDLGSIFNTQGIGGASQPVIIGFIPASTQQNVAAPWGRNDLFQPSMDYGFGNYGANPLSQMIMLLGALIQSMSGGGMGQSPFGGLGMGQSPFGGLGMGQSPFGGLGMGQSPFGGLGMGLPGMGGFGLPGFGGQSSLNPFAGAFAGSGNGAAGALAGAFAGILNGVPFAGAFAGNNAAFAGAGATSGNSQVSSQLQTKIDEMRKKAGPRRTKVLQEAQSALSSGDTSTASSLIEKASKTSSPIVLDLNNNGQADVNDDNWKQDGNFNRQGSANFDLDADGKAEKIEWMKPGQDGLLAYDRNGDGQINNGKELFGNQDGAANGYQRMAQLDADHDGKLSGEELEKLSVWQDNGDAKTQKGELKSLKELGITEINVKHQDQQSTFVRNGQTQKTWDWWTEQAPEG